MDITRGASGEDCKLVVAGQRAGVDAAAAVIEALIAENYTVSVPMEDPDFVGMFVGKKGEAIKKFQVGVARGFPPHTHLCVALASCPCVFAGLR